MYIFLLFIIIVSKHHPPYVAPPAAIPAVKTVSPVDVERKAAVAEREVTIAEASAPPITTVALAALCNIADATGRRSGAND